VCGCCGCTVEGGTQVIGIERLDEIVVHSGVEAALCITV
jgi:hypothetical protein